MHCCCGVIFCGHTNPGKQTTAIASSTYELLQQQCNYTDQIPHIKSHMHKRTYIGSQIHTVRMFFY